jgi:serine/threonine protein kinase
MIRMIVSPGLEPGSEEGEYNVPDQAAPESLGRYQIVRELGKGAMGLVYEGVDPNIGRRVAIKTARRDVMEASGRADEMMERFLREAKSAGALNHPNIITIYDADLQEGLAYIAMEYLDCGDLHDYLKDRRLKPEEAVAIGVQICEALDHACQHGIVHRDVKPANIFMLDDGGIKVGDFGIAHTEDSQLTQTGTMIGTPQYMSPEQFMGQRVDGRSDLFSAGIILYEMLTSEKPFSGDSITAIMHNVTRQDPIPPKELNFAIPDALNTVVMKSLAKSPGERYQTGGDMAAAMREALKPNPNPTVMGTVSQADLGATVASSTTPDMEGTVRASGPAPDSTTAATMMTGTSDQATVLADTAAREAMASSPEKPAAPAGKSKLPLYAGIGAVVLVALIGLIMGLGGEEESSGGATTPPAPKPEFYYSRARITVWGAPDYEAYQEAAPSEGDGDFRHCQELEGTVVVETKENGEWREVYRGEGIHDETIKLPNLTGGRITVSHPDYDPSEKELGAPEKPNQIYAPNHPFVLLRKD